MSINPISPIKPLSANDRRENTSSAAGNSKTRAANASDVYEKSVSTAYAKDQAAIDGLRMQVEAKVGTLRSTVQYLFSMQSSRYDESQGLSIDQIIEKYQGNLKSFFESLTVDPKTSRQAKQDISENGFWGVKQTSERIVDFAKALSGGDSEKADEMKQAFLRGYREAEEAWGGILPDICAQTKDAVMKGFDEWTSNN